jgi:hypothetical protein
LRVERRAVVFGAVTFSDKDLSALSISTSTLRPVGSWVSGYKALIADLNCLSEENVKRIIALAFIYRILAPIKGSREITCQNN